MAIGVGGLDEPDALAAIERGFAAVAGVHRLMSFHEPDSDLSRMNRLACDMPVAVDARVFSVLRTAIALSERSEGTFDMTVGGELVDRGLLPRPDSPHAPAAGASWRDVELIAPDKVRYRRALWVDLGGIAKGYAVDRAIAAMGLPTRVQCSVNAGGDLRIAGPEPERVLLRAPPGEDGAVPLVEIENGSLASSGGGADAPVPHLDGLSRRAIKAGRFVSVAAERCVVADGLTKIVLAKGAEAAPVLQAYGATAYLYDGGWRTIGAAA